MNRSQNSLSVKTGIKAILTLAIIFLILQSNLNAQELFGRIKSPYFGNLTCFVIKSESTLFVGTWGNGISRTTDTCKIWTNVNSGLNDLYINDIFITPNGELYTATESGIYFSSDNGTTWQAKNAGITNPITRTIRMNSNGDLYAGTYGYGVYKSTNKGTSWTAVNKGLWFQNIRTIGFTKKGDILAGTWGEGVYRSTDAGSSWVKSNGGGLKSMYVSDFAINSSGDIYMGTNGTGVWLSVDYGISWIQFDTTKLWDLSVNSLCLMPNGQEPVIATRASGLWRFDNYVYQNWRRSNTLYDVAASCVRISPARKLYATVPYGGLYSSIDTGNTWLPIALKDSGSMSIIVAGKNGRLIAAGKPSGIYRSTNFGSSWDFVGMTTNKIYCLAFDSLNNMYAGTGKGIYRSTNEGTTWSLFGMQDSVIMTMCINSSNHVFAGVHQIYYTKNGGTTWQSGGSSADFGYTVSAIDQTGAIYMGGASNSFSITFNINRSTNGGTSWTSVSNGLKDVKSIAFTISGQVLIGSREGVNRSTDQGNTWITNPVTFGLSDPMVNAISVNTSNHIYVGMNWTMGTYHTSTNFTKWDSINFNYDLCEIGNITSNREGYTYFATNVVYRGIDKNMLVPPTLLSPADGTTSIEVNPSATLTWSPVPKAEMYQLEVSEYVNFSYRIELITKSPTFHILESTLNYATKYFWRVRSKVHSALSEWSPLSTFTTSLQPPVLITPANEKRGVKIISDFLWHPVDSAKTYEIEVSPTLDFKTKSFSKTGVTDTFCTVNSLASYTYYYWRARAVGKLGTSQWCQPWRFMTAVPPPKLRLPADKSTDIDITVKMQWDTVLAASEYYIQLATDSSFDQIHMVFDGKSLESSFHIMPNLDYNKKYYWRVKAGNDDGQSFYSAAWSFTTGIAAPTLQLPADSSKNQKIPLLFSWLQLDSAKFYKLQIAKDNQFNTIVFNDSTLTTTFKEISTLEYYTQYYWRVAAKLTNRTTSWTPIWSFKTILQSPQLTSPVQNATEQPLTLYLRWKKVTGAEYYHFRIGKDIAFVDLVKNVDSVKETEMDVANLDSNTKYYWQVAAFNNEGVSDWSVFGAFTTIAPSYVPEEIIVAMGSLSAVPNPFENEVELSFTLPIPMTVKAGIYNIFGREVSVLCNASYDSGLQRFSWKPAEMPTGIYFCRFEFNGFRETIKLILMK
ncbi:MAG: hypothetical protein HW421_3592 [Ignavibacteria bacterium]|nr:hypothetical protein [Ignavibacteria bacterium]